MMQNTLAVSKKIRGYIVANTLANPDHIEEDTLIFETGLLDSMGLLFLVEFLKEEFKVETQDEDLVVENFESIKSIVNFVESKAQ